MEKLCCYGDIMAVTAGQPGAEPREAVQEGRAVCKASFLGPSHVFLHPFSFCPSICPSVFLPSINHLSTLAFSACLHRNPHSMLQNKGLNGRAPSWRGCLYKSAERGRDHEMLT